MTLKSRIQCQNTPVQRLCNLEGFEFYIKRDDKTFATFGTKLRKLSGLLKHLENQNAKTVLLFGNPHSNYMATFTYMLYLNAYNIVSLHTTKNPKLVTVNSILSKKYSHHSLHCNSKEEIHKKIQIFQNKIANIFLVPEFGIHESSYQGIGSLWKEVDSYEQKFDYIFLDAGSGLTLTSALEHYKTLPTKVISVAIGNKPDKLKEELKALSFKLSKRNIQEYDFELISPAITPGFSKTSYSLSNFIKDFWKEFTLPLEPVYSGKSIYTLIQYIREKKPKGRGIYIHQGGLLNHVLYCL
ncbi:MAG: hypothetical protein H7A23_21280 [Leptospiraceae bacterium]|nr:hypothetical protein [Leptospiraceae bacterium]MCP5497095.1 hypothetical protein [Leptospiraceae bacterium]